MRKHQIRWDTRSSWMSTRLRSSKFTRTKRSRLSGLGHLRSGRPFQVEKPERNVRHMARSAMSPNICIKCAPDWQGPRFLLAAQRER